MIDIKQAVQVAMQAAKEYHTGQEITNIELEEVEKLEDGGIWAITLGYYVPNINPNETALAVIMQGRRQYERKFKTFSISAETGEVLSMKIRQV